MPQKDLHKLLERIHLRLDESMVGIAEQLGDLDAADLAELLNQLTRQGATSVLAATGTAGPSGSRDQPTMRRRAAILRTVGSTARSKQILEKAEYRTRRAALRTHHSKKMSRTNERHRVLPG